MFNYLNVLFSSAPNKTKRRRFAWMQGMHRLSDKTAGQPFYHAQQPEGLLTGMS
jgi:hypothetical protein